MWVSKKIKYANLKFGKYDAWDDNVDCKPCVLGGIKTGLETKNLFGDK